MEKLKTRWRAWIDQRPGLRAWIEKWIFRLKLSVGLVAFLFCAWHGFLFYLDRPADRAIHLELAPPTEVVPPPEIKLGDSYSVHTTKGAKPVMPVAGAVAPLPGGVMEVTKVDVKAPSPGSEPVSVAETVPVKVNVKGPVGVAVKVSVLPKSKFPRGVNSKKALGFFQKKMSESDCFSEGFGAKTATALVKTAPDGHVIAVTLKPVAVKEKRKIASLVKEWTPKSICLKKHLDKAPILKTRAKKPLVSEVLLRFE